MRFSLILATVGRTEEVKRFLEHLAMQTYTDVEVLVIDQNPDEKVATILQHYKDRVSTLHLRSTPGLSRARNEGLKHVSGDIVGFPDDDCWYPRDLLERVALLFGQRPELGGLIGRIVDSRGRPSCGRFSRSSCSVNRFNAWKTGSSASLFVRIEVINRVGGFDDTLGLGAGTPWGAGEETDYLLRALEAGMPLYYDSSLVVYHPQSVVSYNRDAVERARTYGGGIGRVLRKHRYPLGFVIWQWARSAGGVAVSLALGRIGKARYHWSALQGKFLGWAAKVKAE